MRLLHVLFPVGAQSTTQEAILQRRSRVSLSRRNIMTDLFRIITAAGEAAVHYGSRFVNLSVKVEIHYQGNALLHGG